MGRTPLPKDAALQPLNVKVPSEDLYFVQEVLKPALGVSYNAEAVREVLVQLRPPGTPFAWPVATSEYRPAKPLPAWSGPMKRKFFRPRATAHCQALAHLLRGS